MADNTLNVLAAAIRAMEEVVTPAVDAEHPLAREQAELVTGTLKMLREQLPFSRQHRAYELARNVELGRDVLALTEGSLVDNLTDAVTRGERLLDALGPSDEELQTATEETTAVISALVRSCTDRAPDDTTRAIYRLVLEHSKGVIDGQRAWFAAQGWGAEGPTMSELFERDHITTGTNEKEMTSP